MKLGLHLGYWNRNPYPGIAIAQEAENLGYDSIWTAEAYGLSLIHIFTMPIHISTIFQGCVVVRSAQKDRKR